MRNNMMNMVVSVIIGVDFGSVAEPPKIEEYSPHLTSIPANTFRCPNCTSVFTS